MSEKRKKKPSFRPVSQRGRGVYLCNMHNALQWLYNNQSSKNIPDVIDDIKWLCDALGGVPTKLKKKWNEVAWIHGLQKC